MTIELKQEKEHKGLKLDSPTNLDGDLFAVIGKNGAGKTRLLEAIKDNAINLKINDIVVEKNEVSHFNMQQLTPTLQFGFDRVRFREERQSAMQCYESNPAAFSEDKQQTLQQLSDRNRSGPGNLNLLALYNSVIVASKKTGQKMSELSREDIAKYYTSSASNALGHLNITETFLQYADRLAENETNYALNKTYEKSLPVYSDSEFTDIYGPLPWKIFNEVLKEVLDSEYYVLEPDVHQQDMYKAKLLRSSDDKEVHHAHLSSGEQVLLWLVISIYNATISAFEHQKPKIILLDEPDAFLHPQMVEKLYFTFSKIMKSFGCKIIFTTHSPTTVALFPNTTLYQVSENALDKVEQDKAISDLLAGVSKVSISYSNRRQVYVESHYDACIYSELFTFLQSRKIDVSSYISLSFLPTGVKLPEEIISHKLLSVFGELDKGKVDQFITEIQGVGDCGRVYGTVKSLINEGCETVFGIVDWDLKNKNKNNVFVSSENIFYTTENAILNPVTLGFYILQNYAHRVNCVDFGIDYSTPFTEHYNKLDSFQNIANYITKIVIGEYDLENCIECTYYGGANVFLDKSFVHMNGHKLLGKITGAFPFLLEHNKTEAALKIDVIRKGMISFSDGKTIPICLIDIFTKILNSNPKYNGHQ